MKLTHFLMISNLVTLAVLVVFVLNRPESRELGIAFEKKLLSGQPSFEKLVLKNQQDTLAQNDFLVDRLTLLEIKLDDLSIQSGISYTSNLTDAYEEKPPITNSDQKENQPEIYSKAEELTNDILSSGTVTAEQSAQLMSALIEVKDAAYVDELRKKIIVGINKDELKVEPGVIF